jgi:methylmalonyl-CoA/ethylmalonyl-CoA epimerase
VDLGNTKIELLHPLGEKSPISKFLEKKPEGGIHHICIEVHRHLPSVTKMSIEQVDDIEEAIKDLKEKGIVPIDPKPKIGAHGKPVVFLHPKSMNGVLVELEQK